MEQTIEYDVFISYARSDYEDRKTKEKIPNSMVSQIKEYLSVNNISYWFDEDGIYSGDAFAKEIANSIKNSKLFLFISSAHSNMSDWTCREIAIATMYKKKILPVKIDESVYDESVILYLANLDFVDLTRNHEQGLKAMVRSINNFLNNTDSILTPQVKVNINDTLWGIANDKSGDICPTGWAGAVKYGLQKLLRPDVFLCHSIHDRSIVIKLGNLFDMHSITYFDDKEAPILSEGLDCDSLLKQKIMHAKVIVYLSSIHSSISDNVKSELRFSMRCHKPLIILKLDTTPYPDEFANYLFLFPKIDTTCYNRSVEKELVERIIWIKENRNPHTK